MYPLGFVPASHRLMWSLLALAAAGVIGIVMGAIARPMRAAGGPGIVPFELTEDSREARRILTRWGPAGRAAAVTQTYVDVAFLLAYGTALSLFCGYIGRRAGAAKLPDLRTAAIVFAWLAVAAALCDLIEDIAMLVTLAGFHPRDYADLSGPVDRRTGEQRVPNATSVQVSRFASRVKFGLIGVCVLFLPIGIGVLNT